ncbi:transcriptional regulator, LysR family [Limimonas halophila]|uniref:Transcriptional regulator, LysR family n=1 Tax=Limimonas halophila TaxID=1082479 RepID=A0A1G7S2I5_9PROT|nr:LysR substrate-binding domain-containing protein [Limimonas halophila]SDG16649.1 transcriptional regulator, LysR family [Limimonas halophila]
MVYDLDLTLLSAFVTIVETGSFGGAAERLNRGQSAVSMQMRRLEERVEARLLQRNAHTVALTPDGQRLFPYAKRIVEMSEEAREVMSGPALAGELRMGIPEFTSTRMQTVLSRFVRAHPDVHLKINVDASSRLRPAVHAGDLDLALAIRDPEDDAARAVHSERLLWVIGREHTPGIGEAMPLALFDPPCPYREIATGELERFGWRWRETFTSTSVATVRNAVAAGMGLSVFPESAVTDDLRVLGESDGFPALPHTQLAIYENPRHQTETTRQLAAYLADCVREITRVPARP